MGVAVGVFLLGMTWQVSSFQTDSCPGYRLIEGASVDLAYPLWPPGAIDCTFETAPGGAIDHSTYYPWVEWLSTALFAAACGIGYSALMGGVQRRLLRVYVALGLVLAALGAEDEAWVLTAILVGIALGPPVIVAVLRRRRHPPDAAPVR